MVLEFIKGRGPSTGYGKGQLSVGGGDRLPRAVAEGVAGLAGVAGGAAAGGVAIESGGSPGIEGHIAADVRSAALRKTGCVKRVYSYSICIWLPVCGFWLKPLA